MSSFFPSLRTAAIVVVSAGLVLAACSRTAGVVESRPLTKTFDGYRTGAVEVEPRGLEGGVKGSQEFLAYLEKELKTNGVLEPLAAEQGAQLLVRVRQAGTNLGEDDVRVIVDFIDARSGATIGQITVAADGLNDKSGAAMRRVATSIAGYMRKNRHGALVANGRGNPAPAGALPVTSAAPAAGTASSGACTTTCTPDASSALPIEEQTRLAETLQPMLKNVRVCLDRINAENIAPALILRFEGGGQLTGIKMDVGGYEDLACVQDARSKVGPVTPVSRPASVRCDYRCAR